MYIWEPYSWRDLHIFRIISFIYPYSSATIPTDLKKKAKKSLKSSSTSILYSRSIILMFNTPSVFKSFPPTIL